MMLSGRIKRISLLGKSTGDGFFAQRFRKHATLRRVSGLQLQKEGDKILVPCVESLRIPMVAPFRDEVFRG
jgi:hypothetical protein